MNEFTKVHKLALEYQNGNKEVLADILEYYNETMDNYVKLLKYGELDFDDTICCRIVIKYSSKSIKYKKSHSGMAIMLDIAKELSTLFEMYDEDDIRNDFVLAIISKCNNFKVTSDDSLFTSYVYNTLHYDLFRALCTYRRGYNNIYSIKENELDYSTDDYFEKILNNTEKINMIQNSNSIITVNQNNNAYSDLFLDSFNWLEGITCSDAFSTLNGLERKILVMYYYHGMNDEQIAKEFGYCRQAINKKRASALSKLNDKVIQ